MKEIEVKAYLKNRELVVENLTKLGCVFDEAIFQDSMDFSLVQNPTLTQYLAGGIFLRIRTTNNKHVFSIKKPIVGEHQLSKIEHETEITNRAELEKLLGVMGYFPALQIKKERVIGHLNGYEICLDEVENIGSFIEVEKMSDEDPKIVRAQLEQFLFSIGVSPEDETHDGYDILMFRYLENK
jgi:adenylate cyclase class 2